MSHNHVIDEDEGNHGGGRGEGGAVCPEIETATTAAGGTLKSVPPPYVVIGMDGRKFFRSACKARNVSPDHTEETAYLLIPEDAPHGYFMRCSHALCVKTGRQFRYCAACRQAVTRRNFHKRHDHGLIEYDGGGRPILPASSERKDEEVNAAVISSAVDAAAATEGDQTTLDNPSHLKRRRGEGMASLKPESSMSSSQVQARMKSPRAGVVSSDDDDRRQGAEFGLPRTEEDWLALYHKRPKSGPRDRIAMTRWVTSLLSAAYPRSFTGKQDASSSEKASTSDSSEDELLASLDDVLGDFDKNLDGFVGDWSLRKAKKG